MADTGAPWNIPYIEPGDIVRDYPAADEAQALAVAAGLTAAGVIKQVAQTVKTDTFSSTSSTYENVTGLSVSITPESDTNKVLLIVAVNMGQSFTGGNSLRVTGGNAGNYVGAAAGSRTQAALNFYARAQGVTEAIDRLMMGFSFAYLDAPASASSVTYQVQVRRDAGTAFINRSATDTDNSGFARGASSITAIEVAA